MLVVSHLRWLPGHVRLLGQFSWLSSDVLLSLQSFTPLHSCVFGMQRKFAHVNSPSGQGGYSQSSSSVLSPQSFSWSHFQVLKIQRPFPHLNSVGPHVC
uniref:Uncharacterized protein n=1 Tax=Ixodes ricinus TaxID=34613 RepID=A0A147BT57_IXORI